jgi:RHH-type transcriptional regulator, rel operon repressor / antitoxin RelB
MARVLTVRVSEEMESRLEALSSKTKRPKSFYVKDMLEKYLDEYEDAYLALERLSEKKAKYYSTKEVEKLLET